MPRTAIIWFALDQDWPTDEPGVTYRFARDLAAIGHMLRTPQNG